MEETLDIINQFKFTKIAEETYAVSLDGTHLGDIVYGWSRIGGNGWVHGLGKASYGNRKLCALDLYRRLKKESK